jgi:hypothetical protein
MGGGEIVEIFSKLRRRHYIKFETLPMDNVQCRALLGREMNLLDPWGISCLVELLSTSQEDLTQWNSFLCARPHLDAHICMQYTLSIHI